MKKILALILALVLSVSVFVGCSQPADTESTQTAPATTDEQAENSDQEPVKIVLELGNFVKDYPAVEKALNDVMAMEKYAHVEFELLPVNADYQTTMPIAVSSGEQRDILAVTSPMLQQQWADAGVIQPLDSFVDAAGIDLDAEYGQYKANGIKNDQFFIIPNVVNQWVLFYNKGVFDAANVEYPSATEPMTWDEYQDVALQLTQGEGADKTYGVFNMNWLSYWQAPAVIELGGGEQFYNADGLSNIEDPAFASAIQRYYDMLEVDKSAPTWADVATTKVDVNEFLSGKYGMSMHASWMWSKLVDDEGFPRDYGIGIAPIPNDSGDLATWGSVNGFCIGSTSANPQLATEIAIDMSRIFAQYTDSAVGANQTYEQTELYKAVGEALTDEGVTQEDILFLTNNPDMAYYSEKILGPNNVAYEKVVQEEVELFFVGEQSLEDTIANIKTRGDEAILAE